MPLASRSTAKSKVNLVVLSLVTRALDALRDVDVPKASALLEQAISEEPLGKCKRPDCKNTIPPERYFAGLSRPESAGYCGVGCKNVHNKRIQRRREAAAPATKRRKRT